MRWFNMHDSFLFRELMVHETYQYKKGSSEQGKCWEAIADILNAAGYLYFKVQLSAVRDHLNVLIDSYKRKVGEEEKASGIDVSEAVIDIALANIIDRFKEADEAYAAQNDTKKIRMLLTRHETKERNAEKITT